MEMVVGTWDYGVGSSDLKVWTWDYGLEIWDYGIRTMGLMTMEL